MYYQYKHNLEKDVAKNKVDELVSEFQKQRFAGFETKEFYKSWTEDEMQASFYIKKGPLERRIKGTIKVNENIIRMDFELPDIIKNFITDQKIENAIFQKLEESFNNGNART